MATFLYQAYDRTGQRIRGEIEATSEEAANLALDGRGLLPFETVEVAGSRPPSTRGFAGSVDLGELAREMRQLQALADAGLPIDQALKLLTVQTKSKREAAFVNGLHDTVTSGGTLSAALASSQELPRFVAPLIRAGEARGTLVEAFGDVAKLLERRIDVQSELRSALVYPAVLAVVALVTIGIVVGVLVPTLAPLFRDSGHAPPALLAFAEQVVHLLANHGVLAVAAFFASLATLAAAARTAAARRWRDKLVLRLPIAGSIAHHNAVALFAGTLGTLLSNGVSLITGLKLVNDVTSNEIYRDAVTAVTQEVEEGGKLAAALSATGVFPQSAIRFVAIGEEASRLDAMLRHLGELEDKARTEAMRRLMTLLTPSITVAVGLIVGGLVLSVMQAILSVNSIAIR